MSKFLDENGLKHLIEKIKNGGIVERLSSNIKPFNVRTEDSSEMSSIKTDSMGVVKIYGGTAYTTIMNHNDVIIKERNVYGPLEVITHQLSKKVDALEINVLFGITDSDGNTLPQVINCSMDHLCSNLCLLDGVPVKIIRGQRSSWVIYEYIGELGNQEDICSATIYRDYYEIIESVTEQGLPCVVPTGVLKHRVIGLSDFEKQQIDSLSDRITALENAINE